MEEAQAQMQALGDKRYTSAEFVDDYRLLVTFESSNGDPLRVLLMDTEKDVGGGTPVQTSFCLPHCFNSDKSPSILLERGAHRPSSAGYLTPFYQDSTQRIAVLDTFHPFPYLVFPVEALLKLARDHEGCEVEWEGWKKHVVFPYVKFDFADAWVSGCRLFLFKSHRNTKMEVYDFSMRGHARHLREETHSKLGVVKRLQPTRVKLCPPWRREYVFDMYGGYDSILFFQVSALRLSLITRLNDFVACCCLVYGRRRQD